MIIALSKYQGAVSNGLCCYKLNTSWKYTSVQSWALCEFSILVLWSESCLGDDRNLINIDLRDANVFDEIPNEQGIFPFWILKDEKQN